MNQQEQPPNSKWLTAHFDPKASLNAVSTCMALADLNGDGDYKLVLADCGAGSQYGMKLKVYKGSTLISENTIIDTPTAICTFFMDQSTSGGPGRVPAVALASGCCLYVYKNLKPYYKFTLPGLSMDEREKDIWERARIGKIDANLMSEGLETLRAEIGFSRLTPKSQRFLLLEDSVERNKFFDTYKTEVMKKPTVITVVTTMKKSSPQMDALDCFVLGTESRSVHVIDSQAFTILTEIKLPQNCVPVHMNASGLCDVEYRIIVACRNGYVFSIKRGLTVAEKPIIQLESLAVGLTKIQKTIIIGCVDTSLRGYTLKGRRSWSIQMPTNITCMELMEYKPRNYQAVLVGLANNEIRIYMSTFLVDIITLEDIPLGLKFGCLGREEGGLAITTKSGALYLKLFKRTARLEEKSPVAGPPPVQWQKLNVPKKTKVFVDQTTRERECAQEMHQNHQKQFFILRHRVAESYVKMLEQNLAPLSQSSSAGDQSFTKLSVQIHGFGPNFQMKIYLQSLGEAPRTDLNLGFAFDTKLYRLEKPILPLPMISPNIKYCFENKIFALSDNGMADDVKIFLVQKGRHEPLLTAIVSMPVAEPSLI